MLRKKVDTPLTKAILAEIKTLADSENFTLGTLKSIERVAAHGRAMLQGTAELDALLGGGLNVGQGEIGMPDLNIDDIESDLMGSYSAIAASSPVENFGSRAMREVVAMLPKILEGRNKTSTIELVRALAVARKEGLDDVAKDLEQQIKGVTAETPKPKLNANTGARPLPNGAYYRPDPADLRTGRYIERDDPEWKLEEYNALTGADAKATDFPPVTIEPPVIGGAA